MKIYIIYIFIFILNISCVADKNQNTNLVENTENQIAKEKFALDTIPVLSETKLTNNKTIDVKSCEFGSQIKDEKSLNLKFIEVKKILTNKCLSCHNENSTDKSNLDLPTTQNFINLPGINNKDKLLINPNDKINSLLLTMLENNGGSMPSLNDSEIQIFNNWISSIDYECLKEKEVETKSSSTITKGDLNIIKHTSTFKTSTYTRYQHEIELDLNKKFKGTFSIYESGDHVITFSNIKNFTKTSTDIKNSNFGIKFNFSPNLTNSILNIAIDKNYSTFDNLFFSLSKNIKINLLTGILFDSDFKLNSIPRLMPVTKNKFKISYNLKGNYILKTNEIILENKIRNDLPDATFVENIKKYTIINDSKFTYSNEVTNFGPKNSIKTVNNLKTEIILNAFIKNDEIVLEKKILKSLEDDGQTFDGVDNGKSITGSTIITSTINKNNLLSSNVSPYIFDKKIKPDRSCNLNLLTKKINTENTKTLKSFNKNDWLDSKFIDIRFGDRVYVLSVLAKIFGEKALVYTSPINKSFSIFGGNYDPYDLVFNNPVYSDNLQKLILGPLNENSKTPEGFNFERNGNGPNISQIGPLNPLRVAITTKVCEDITKNENLILFAVEQILNKQITSKANLPYPFKNDLIKIHNLFYPVEQIDEDSIDSLICVADQFNNPFDQWRNLLLSICITPNWQIP